MIEYLMILVVLLVITIILEKIYRIHLYHNFKERISVMGILFIICVLWDTFAIWRGHWMFPPGKNLGIIIGLMPLEEYLFILIVPYFALTIYKIFDSKYKKKKKNKERIKSK